MNEDEVVRLTNLLSAAVKFSNITQREVERKLGLSSGSLSRLFSGGIELKVKHILDICEVIGFSPARFFHAAYPHREEESGEAWRLQRLLEQLHPAEGSESMAEEPEAPPAPAPSQAEIERMVLAALGKFFSEMGKPVQP
jgi:transcriptional regulator with XRE-family HTH domain